MQICAPRTRLLIGPHIRHRDAGTFAPSTCFHCTRAPFLWIASCAHLLRHQKTDAGHHQQGAPWWTRCSPRFVPLSLQYLTNHPHTTPPSPLSPSPAPPPLPHPPLPTQRNAPPHHPLVLCCFPQPPSAAGSPSRASRAHHLASSSPPWFPHSSPSLPLLPASYLCLAQSSPPALSRCRASSPLWSSARLSYTPAFRTMPLRRPTPLSLPPSFAKRLSSSRPKPQFAALNDAPCFRHPVVKTFLVSLRTTNY
ncbi:unnamed protein product [Chondrus crispus]|uniref:Uncharacterized protein n=1 Tax=Chondrus crispus TaxID=2769 RepID=R7QJ96_CHOCR|nr:unnamed protein product [Chondrus crispus]CDF37521.1 unnamed protein product [Chondrus crispus]|eukprot:XP_005717392.1 unnamed protein product [Chondrus crispus]